MFKLDFRIWDEEKEKMIYCVDQEIERDKMVFWFDKNNTDFNIEEVMLYSTLKDDVGLKIYDGDIVKVHNERESCEPYLSVVTVDLINGTTITPHPKLQKLGINYQIPITEYINKRKNTSCVKVGNICTYPHLLDKIDEDLQDIMDKDFTDDYINIYYEKRKKVQDNL